MNYLFLNSNSLPVFDKSIICIFVFTICAISGWCRWKHEQNRRIDRYRIYRLLIRENVSDYAVFIIWLISNALVAGSVFVYTMYSALIILLKNKAIDASYVQAFLFYLGVVVVSNYNLQNSRKSRKKAMYDSINDNRKMLDTAMQRTKEELAEGLEPSNHGAGGILRFYAKVCRERTCSINLKGLRLCNAYIADAELNGIILIDCDLSGANLTDVNFNDAILFGTNFSGAKLDGCKFNNAKIDDTTIFPDNLPKVYLKNANRTMTRTYWKNLHKVLKKIELNKSS